MQSSDIFPFFRLQGFYVSSSANNCQLSELDVDQTISSDITQDSSWNIYERDFSPICDERFNNDGNGGGILDDPPGSG